MIAAAQSQAFNAPLAPMIIAFPLIGAAVLLFFGRRIGRVSGIVGSAAIGLSFAIGLLNFVQLLAVPGGHGEGCLLYTSPSPRDRTRSRMPSSA